MQKYNKNDVSSIPTLSKVFLMEIQIELKHQKTPRLKVNSRSKCKIIKYFPECKLRSH